MAWYEGTMLTNGAGELLTVLDAKLPINPRWSIYDAAAGTNCKVYRNYDAGANVDYCVKVDDNYAGYAIVELWEGWNPATHVGVGSSYTLHGTYTLRIFKVAGGWGLSVRDHRFIYCEFSTYSAVYVGQLKRFDLTKNMPCIICNDSGGSTQNPLGRADQANNTVWRSLFDELANVGREIRPNAYYNPSLPIFHLKTIAGTYLVTEHPVFNAITGNLMGVIEGVTWMHCNADGLSNGDIITVAGIDWIFMGKGGAYCLVEKG
jgi:hypothetical protein